MASKDALWNSGHDESVEVNQRALIDKVLARYSGEFTVFRELLQNSDDAQSRAVEIKFETKSYLDQKKNVSNSDIGELSGRLPDLKKALVHQWSFKNNGILFRDEDWSRLKKIAEGNPDEEKIGAFGVGFYSLFSVTEEPFVTSGDQWMGFYWKDKKDQLFARRGKLPHDTTPELKAWTSFEMPLREPAPIPTAFDFTRFLASSITFMTHLSEISVFFDDKCLTKLTKSSGLPKELGIPKGLKNSSRMGIMTVNNIKSRPLHIQAQVMRWVYSSGSERPPLALKPSKPAGHGGFFSSLFSSLAGGTTPHRSSTPTPTVPVNVTDPLTTDETSVSLSIFSAEVTVRLDKKIAGELHRSTKKNPPAKLTYELIYTAKNEYDASREEDRRQKFATGSIFQGLRADLDGTGSARIFIGHATAQTTGLGGHMSARFIPTVERESIDFMDRNVGIWNKELLYVGGFVARAAYEFELRSIKELWETGADSAGPHPDMQTLLQRRSLHALKFFTFHPSTPSSEVSSLLEAAFFSCCSEHQFPLVSTKGVRNSADIRLPNATFTTFLKDLPTLPEEIVSEAPSMVSLLQNRGLIKEIAFDDVLKELESRPLPEQEMIACLKWWINVYKEGDNSRLDTVRKQLLDAASFTTQMGGVQKKIRLNAIRSFINQKTQAGGVIPLDGPLPEYLLPISISKAFSSVSIVNSFPWKELTVTEWLRYICTPGSSKIQVQFDINTSAMWAERVLNVLARAWPTFSGAIKEEITKLLSTKTCIPTSSGMKLPDQAYFPTVNIFNDLPVVMFPNGSMVKGPLEKVLEALGVRKHVDLQVIFNRMIKTNEWTIADLTRYLVSVKGTLTAEELARLKRTPAFPMEVVGHSTPDNKAVRCHAEQLYEPVEVFRQLGLPVIDWGGQAKWRPSSEEAKFLFELGLKRYPPLDVLINLCASENTEIRSIALKYLIDNIGTRYSNYEPTNFSDISFIPTVEGLRNPREVFSNPEWVPMGFLAIHPNLQANATKLKIRDHPSTSQLVALLEKTPPQNQTEARTWFTLLSGRVHDFGPAELRRLSNINIVPVNPEKGAAGPTIRYLPPTQCYLGIQSKGAFHSKLFVFVDFGTAGNAFLTACGAKQEPSVEELAKVLLANPHHFYELSQGAPNFLAELRNIAVNSRLLSSGTITRMKAAPVLLGSQRKPRNPSTPKDINDDDFGDDEWDRLYDLKKADQIIIEDDTHAYQAFGDQLFIAPQEEILEAFYLQLGSRRLSSLVKEEYHTSSELMTSKVGEETRSLILERLPLFLHEHNHARTRVSYSWLSSQSNFVVKTFGKLSVNKSLNFGDLRLSRNQDASAIAKRFGYGPIQLWLAGNSQVDMYEVATSLNRLLFESPKANDALLFMTILSTDLRALKRRGYNVDRILRQQKAQRQATEDAKAKEQISTTLMSKPPQTFAKEPEKMLEHTEPTLPGGFPTKPMPTATISNALQQFTRRIGKNINPTGQEGVESSLRSGEVSRLPPQPPLPALSPALPPKHSLATVAPHPVRSPGPTVTPLSNISSNIDMAIKACRPESGNLLRNRQEMQQVKESLNEGYCDISGRVGNLTFIGEICNLKVYLSQEVPDAQTFIQTKSGPLSRFIDVATKLARVYELPLTSLHIFYDLEGGLIAFNRNGSVFLNLRYYEAWHDADVHDGKHNSAFISWYFTLAHEIAHNLVQPHNSEHEFYFSAICEKYIMSLGGLLSSKDLNRPI
ncbi:hypothetical protein BDQ12DRAFT_730629 [Crucibulum laeve]|uniref:Sacsin/Nov domain-containing protein n=1 Tax=Crucibulum laeve TaxID=68775 RepID=A0A5C3MI33_9AGAR|nr:hypothetical protein BDQ12DRAFT_730629 [Crucibulum laeve]